MQNNNLILNSINSLEEIVENSENYTLIEIDSKIYAIKTKNVLEIIKVIDMDYSHQMPTYVLGLIEFESAPIGVIDLREIFKKERITYDLSAKIIVIKARDCITSIICDKVYDIKKLPTRKIQQVPYQQETNYFDGLYNDNQESAYILNIDNIINYVRKNPNQFMPSDNEIKYLVSDEESKEILKTRKEMLLKITSEIQSTRALYDRGVSFSVNNVKYYINMASVKEFYKVNNSKFIKIPNTQDYIYGLINIKGEYYTVLDLRRFLNIIILNSEEFKLGVLADEICESMDVDFDEIIQNRLQNQDDSKMMEFVKDGEIYQVLDMEKLLRDDRLTIA